MNEKVMELLKKLREPKRILAVGAIGILLLLLPSFFSKNYEKSSNSKDDFNAEEYRKELEKDVKKIVTEITGDKKATVVITLQNGIKYSYADDIKDDTSVSGGENSEESKRRESSHITVKNASGDEKALVVTENMPEVRGVAVICSGGEDEYTAEIIINSITATLDITSKRVYVAGKYQY